MTLTDGTADVKQALAAIGRPRRLLDRDHERSLTERQRELLDQLQQLFFAEGFATQTMAGLASELSCSLRTLYALAPSRDELVLIVVDRNLWRVGQQARGAIDPSVTPLAALRVYLQAATVAVSGWTEPFVRDLAAVPAAEDLAAGHRRYLYEVVKALLDLAVRRGDIVDVDTAALARVLARLGRLFSEPEVIGTLRSTPKDAADEVLDVVLCGLARTSP